MVWVHEYLAVDTAQPRQLLNGVNIIAHPGEGARSQHISAEQKFLRDAELLETALRGNPGDARSQFYLAQSYRDAGHYDKALIHYQRRAQIPGWDEETFYAYMEVAVMMTHLNKPYDDIVTAFLKAYEMRPSRAETLWQLASFCRRQERYAHGYLFAKTGCALKLPNDRLFVRTDVYQWRLLDEFAVCAYWIGEYQESAQACQKILSEPVL